MELARLEVIGTALLCSIAIAILTQTFIVLFRDLFSMIYKLLSMLFKLVVFGVLVYLLVSYHEIILPYIKDICEKADDILKLS